MKIISILMGTFLAIQTAFIAGMYNGHGFGTDLCTESANPFYSEFLISHSQTLYDQLSQAYVYVYWSLFIYVFSELICRKALAQIVPMLSASVAVILLLRIQLLSSDFVYNGQLYFDLLRATVPYGLAYILAAIGLMVYQAIITARNLFEFLKNRKSGLLT